MKQLARLAWLSLVVGFAACSTYDATLLDDAAGAAYPARTEPDAGSAEQGGDAAPAPPEAVPEACGDGKVALSEKCDIAIADGAPGACPSSCPPLVDCVARALEGSNCQAQCVVLAQACANGDGCCPAACNRDSDDDCSERCGDGIVQSAEGETCEPASARDACTTAAECDDGNPCTEDVLTGSEANCNARCSHAPIAALSSGDGCCPEGADANADGDCTPVCGNGVREADEECDGGSACDDACKLTLTSEQVACFAQLGESANDCDRCSCMHCAPQRLGCVDSGDAVRDAHCEAIIQCANDNDCAGAACYCGDAYCWTDGPCEDVIESAAAADPSGTPGIAQGDDPNTAIGRAIAVGECKAASCSDVCP